jgi:hypothetical protein
MILHCCKLERLSVQITHTQIKYLLLRVEASALSSNIRLRCKWVTVTNAQAYNTTVIWYRSLGIHGLVS